MIGLICAATQITKNVHRNAQGKKCNFCLDRKEGM